MPALREHKEDLPQLMESLLKKMGYPTVRISDEAMECLMAYNWPGNVRELENVLQQTLLLSPFLVILPEHLPERMRFKTGSSGKESALTPLEGAERGQILQALKTTEWNQSRAAALLGIDRKTLRTKIQRYGFVREDSLQGCRHFRNFIEKNGPTLRGFKKPGMGMIRPRECPFFVTKKF